MVKVKEDLTGRRFGKLVVLEQVEDHISSSNKHYAQWKCECDCGKQIIVRGDNLRNGAQSHCGCDYMPSHEYKVNLRSQRIGEKGRNRQGEEMMIIEYRHRHDIDVKFLRTGFISQHTSYAAFSRGTIKDYKSPSLCGIGIIGDVEYTDSDLAQLPAYQHWKGMLMRCTHSAFHKNYGDCQVSNEWKNFDCFLRWFNQNTYQCGDEPMALDKDWLCKGNKIYAPEFCILVPRSINLLLTKSNARRGNLPIGVTYDKARHKYAAVISIDGIPTYIGRYHTPEEAFQAYKKAKEQHIKDVADEYKAKYPDFPQKLYDAMYAYEVEITD